MIPHDMPFRCHAFHEFRLILQIMPCNEKRGRHLLVTQNIQNRRRKSILIPVVKREVQFLLFRISQKNGIILLQNGFEAFLINGRQLAVLAFLKPK